MIRRPPNDSPRQEAQSGAGRFFMTICNNGEPGYPSPTWRDNSASVDLVQLGSLQTDGGDSARTRDETT